MKKLTEAQLNELEQDLEGNAWRETCGWIRQFEESASTGVYACPAAGPPACTDQGY